MLNSFSGFTVPNEEDLGGTGVLQQAIPVPMGAGGILALDSFVIHGSAENRTKGTRMSLTLGYHSVDELAGYDNPKRVLVRGKRFYMGND